ncbi:MAG: hypothetical protein JHD31_06105 [Rhodoluna sp.]|nr:hypothetical protein [Rhodoluna sp.]
MSSNQNVVICSFYTADDYYRSHGERLAKNLDELGVKYVLREIEKQEGEDWADICRKKVGFLADVCAEHPDKKVFWIDVDCSLLELPEYISNSTADIIGFQRGYSSPSSIGYHRRTRFWEPSFWGVNTTPLARKMIAEAYELEKTSTLKATDDYFMEEAWRANCDNMTFQIIPSNAVIGKGSPNADSAAAFFNFGASGNVAHFRGKVQQHESKNGGLRESALKIAKKIERKLPYRISKRLRLLVDTIGITGLLTTRKLNPESQERKVDMNAVINSAQAGNSVQYEDARNKFQRNYLATQMELNNIAVAKSFHFYAAKESTKSIGLVWWVRPFPGNFGDWLSPLIVSQYTDNKIFFQSPVKIASKKHMIGLGSIGRFIKPNSVVVGTGISTDELTLAKSATYVSVRGPVTARVVKESGGPTVESFGDPGVLISRIFPVTRSTTNGKVALVRHFTHKPIPLVLDSNMEELDIFTSHPDDIKTLVHSLNLYDRVVTSAMHIFITCQSYGIPCALITFEGFADSVHGNGIKYGDYAEGVGLASISPIPVGLNLNIIDFDNITTNHKISETKMNEVEEAIKKGLSYLN